MRFCARYPPSCGHARRRFKCRKAAHSDTKILLKNGAKTERGLNRCDVGKEFVHAFETLANRLPALSTSLPKLP